MAMAQLRHPGCSFSSCGPPVGAKATFDTFQVLLLVKVTNLSNVFPMQRPLMMVALTISCMFISSNNWQLLVLF
jgi:hypothetical protein